MSNSAKKVFYPSEKVEEILKEIPKGQFSSRINELLLKGVSLEKQEAVKLAYLQFDQALAKETSKRAKAKSSTTKLLSKRAFEPEDEVEDFI